MLKYLFSQQSKYEAHTDQGDSNHTTKAGPESSPQYDPNLPGYPLGLEDRQVIDVFEPSEPEEQAESLKRNANITSFQWPSMDNPQFDPFDNNIFELVAITWMDSVSSTDNIKDQSFAAGGVLSGGLEDNRIPRAPIAANLSRQQYSHPSAP